MVKCDKNEKICYKTTMQAAKSLGVSSRAVQKWALSGKIPDAKKKGNKWLIPEVFINNIADNNLKINSEDKYMPLLLLSGSYQAGACKEYISKIENYDYRNIALAEYNYALGNNKIALKIAESYINSDDIFLKYSSLFIKIFSYLSQGESKNVKLVSDDLKQVIYDNLKCDLSSEHHSISMLMELFFNVLFHIPVANSFSFERCIKYLPNKMKLWACYVLARKLYIEKDYYGCYYTARMSIAVCSCRYPLAEIYCRIAIVMALIKLKKIDEAEKHFMDAWNIASADGIISPFIEHYSFLHGMVERCLKRNSNNNFNELIKKIYTFHKGWIKIHNRETGENATEELSTTEYSIAMLYSQKWTAKEISEYLNISERTVYRHIANIYSKLYICKSEKLKEYLVL